MLSEHFTQSSDPDLKMKGIEEVKHFLRADRPQSAAILSLANDLAALKAKTVTDSRSFEDTNLGRLPPEILLKILADVVPNCKECFRQRDLLKLCMVCKRLYQLTKTADLYREIRLTEKCCPLPSVNIFEAMLDVSGAQLRKVTFNLRSFEMLSRPVLEKRCNTIKEIEVEEQDRIGPRPEIWLKMSKSHLPALTHFTHFRYSKMSIRFTLAPMEQKDMPFPSRIQSIDFLWCDPEGSILLEQKSFGRAAGIFMGRFQNLKRVRNKMYSLLNCTESVMEMAKEGLGEYTLISQCEVSWRKEEGEIVLEVARND